MRYRYGYLLGVFRDYEKSAQVLKQVWMECEAAGVTEMAEKARGTMSTCERLKGWMSGRMGFKEAVHGSVPG